MTKQKLMSTSAPPPSGEGSCSKEKLFEEPEERKSPKAPDPGRDPLDGMTVYLHFADLKQIGINWTRQYLNELEELGQFPARVKLSSNTIAWLASEISAWQRERNAQRKKPAQGEAKSKETSDVRAAG